MKLKITLILFLITSISYSQTKLKGNKNVTQMDTPTEHFNTIVLGEKLDVTLSYNNQASVEIETDENLHEAFQIKVLDSTLSIKSTAKITSKKELKININYTDVLKTIVLNDNAQISAASAIKNNAIELKINNGAKAFLNLRTKEFKLINNTNETLKFSKKSKLNIESEKVHLELNERSRTDALITADLLTITMQQKAVANLEGNTNNCTIKAFNTSNLNAKNLTAKTATITSEDSSDVSINTEETMQINASGNSEIYIYGNPKIELNTFSNSAKLYKKEL